VAAGLTVGATTQLTLRPRLGPAPPSAVGRDVATSNGAVATVSASGLVTGVAGRLSDDYGDQRGQSGTSALTVTTCRGLGDDEPGAATVTVGTTTQLTATPKTRTAPPSAVGW